jgi:hypothetical protein
MQYSKVAGKGYGYGIARAMPVNDPQARKNLVFLTGPKRDMRDNCVGYKTNRFGHSRGRDPGEL